MVQICKKKSKRSRKIDKKLSSKNHRLIPHIAHVRSIARSKIEKKNMIRILFARKYSKIRLCTYLLTVDKSKFPTILPKIPIKCTDMHVRPKDALIRKACKHACNMQMHNYPSPSYNIIYHGLF